MTIQTTYVPAEDDPANWFTAKEVAGPAIITAITGGAWVLHDMTRPEPRDRSILEFGTAAVLAKFFVPIGHVLRVHQGNASDRTSFVSGYRLVPVR